MTEKSGKKKTKKGAKAGADPSVLGTLRSTRPSRIGAERRGASATRTSKPVATKPAAARAKRSSSATTATSKSRSSATPGTKSSGTKARPKPATTAKPAAATRPEPPPLRPPPPPPQPRGGRPSGTAIVTTAVQAAGEIAQIGVTVGRQVLKRAAGRIPRP